jgi:hypothetical protein
MPSGAKALHSWSFMYGLKLVLFKKEVGRLFKPSSREIHESFTQF